MIIRTAKTTMHSSHNFERKLSVTEGTLPCALLSCEVYLHYVKVLQSYKTKTDELWRIKLK